MSNSICLDILLAEMYVEVLLWKLVNIETETFVYLTDLLIRNPHY